MVLLKEDTRKKIMSYIQSQKKFEVYMKHPRETPHTELDMQAYSNSSCRVCIYIGESLFQRQARREDEMPSVHECRMVREQYRKL